MNQTQQQVIELSNTIEQEARRVARWAIGCLIFALATFALVAATKSFFFLIVALYACFFVWNRWRLWRFLIACLPPRENSDAWFEKTVQGLLNPPSWYRFSEHVATVTFLMLFGIITFVVTSNSGTWMRLLYAVGWVAIAIRIVVAGIAYRRPKRTNNLAN